MLPETLKNSSCAHASSVVPTHWNAHLREEIEACPDLWFSGEPDFKTARFAGESIPTPTTGSNFSDFEGSSKQQVGVADAEQVREALVKEDAERSHPEADNHTVTCRSMLDFVECFTNTDITIVAFQGHPEFIPDYSREIMNLRHDMIGAERVAEGMASFEKREHEGDRVARWMLAFLSR